MTFKIRKNRSHTFTWLMCGAARLCTVIAVSATVLTVEGLDSQVPAASLGQDVGIGRVATQAGIKRGSWVFLPSISNGLLYDSNLFNQSTGAQDELVAFSVPKIIAVKNFKNGAVTIDLESVMAKYLYDDSNSYTDLSAGLSGVFSIAPRVKLSASSDWQKFSELRSATNQEIPSGAIEPITGISFNSSIKLAFDRNRLQHSIEAAYSQKNYNDVLGIVNNNVTIIDQDVRNTESWAIRKSLDYTFSRYVKISGLGSVEWSFSPNNPVRDVTTYDLSSGIEISWTSKVSTAFNVALSKEEFHNAPDSDLLPSYEGSLTWKPTEKLSLSINASQAESGRNFEEGSSSSLTRGLSGEMTYLVNRNLSVKAATSYSKSDQVNANTQTDKTVESRDLELSAQYAINRNMGLSLGYTYSERESTDAGDSYDKETIQGNIVTKF